MSDATPMNDADLRVFAQAAIDQHTPANQRLQGGEGVGDNPYDRCALCHFTRHPCDVYDLAAGVLRLLDSPLQREIEMQKARNADLQEENTRLRERYIEATNPGIDMDEVRKQREAAAQASSPS